ncbi:MAG TPA: vanadium-dependent haloperoxidase, partial [Gemmataceae bacterium]|nr:vanadium-dependent haloperoxidase [Gemmataceae bacterium]
MGLLKPRVLRVQTLEDRSVPSAAFVTDWNDLLVDVQRLRGQGNQQSARALAMVNAAIYDSVNAINPTHEVYKVPATPPAGTSDDAAAAQAAHDVAFALYTQSAERSRIDGLLNTQLDDLVAHGETGIDEGVTLGQFVASQILVWRTGDGSATPPNVTYDIGSDPGDWQPTPPANNPIPVTTWWPGVTPFALESGSQFRAPPPPALTSDKYTEAFEQVKSLGNINSTTRTPEQTEIARFWADPASNSGVAIWSQITETVSKAHDLTLADNARLYAQVSVANADAFIASFDTKYTYNFWRPVTAIPAAATDGNPDTAPDSSWMPLINTPNHPSYASNHSSQSRAAAEALAAFFGTDQVSFTAKVGTVERSYNKFTDAAKEAGKSRIFAGIHWSFDVAAGEALGRKVGQYVADHFFQPVAAYGGGAHQVVLPRSGLSGLSRGHEAGGVMPNAMTAGARRTVGPVLPADVDALQGRGVHARGLPPGQHLGQDRLHLV